MGMMVVVVVVKSLAHRRSVFAVYLGELVNGAATRYVLLSTIVAYVDSAARTCNGILHATSAVFTLHWFAIANAGLAEVVVVVVGGHYRVLTVNAALYAISNPLCVS